MNLEGRISRETGDALAALGHDVQWWPERTARAASVCALLIEPAEGLFHAGADFRRANYALGW